jgi:hypothetical protein
MVQDPQKNDRPVQEPLPPVPEVSQPVQPDALAPPAPQAQGNQPQENTISRTGLPNNKNADIWKSKELYITLGLLAFVILMGAVAFSILERWRRRQIDSGSEQYTGTQLSNFREMLENGEITQSEYERIRDKMASKIKQDVLSKRVKPVHTRINPNATPEIKSGEPNPPTTETPQTPPTSEPNET